MDQLDNLKAIKKTANILIAQMQSSLDKVPVPDPSGSAQSFYIPSCGIAAGTIRKAIEKVNEALDLAAASIINSI